MYLSVCVCVCVCVYIYVCVCVCMYVYATWVRAFALLTVAEGLRDLCQVQTAKIRI